MTGSVGEGAASGVILELEPTCYYSVPGEQHCVTLAWAAVPTVS